MDFIKQKELGELIKSARANILKTLYENVPAEKLITHHLILDHIRSQPEQLFQHLPLMGDSFFSSESEYNTQLNSLQDINYISTQLCIIEKAKKHIVEAYLPLVATIAQQYKDQNEVHFLDLILDGNLGLMKAVDHYNYINAHSFLAYATRCIHRSIANSIARTLIK